MNRNIPEDRSLLICHTGKADYCTRSSLATLEKPEQLGPRHHPVSFYNFVERVMAHMDTLKWNIDAEAHVINHDGQKFFSTFAVSRPPAWTNHFQPTKTWQQLVGLRGSHDQSLPRGIVFGNKIMVCDNLLFSGSVGSFKTKQTTFVGARLDDMILKALDQLGAEFTKTDRQFKQYTTTELSDPKAHSIFAHAYRSKALTSSALGDTIDEWHNPRHTPELNKGTVWGALQAMTLTIKAHTKNNLHLQNRTHVAGQLIDAYCPA